MTTRTRRSRSTGGTRDSGRTGTPGGTGSRLARTGTAAALAAAFGLFLAGCGAGAEGVRDEGAARADAASQTASPSSAASASPAPKVDAVAILKKDPKISAEVRKDLKPCAGSEYPVDVSYGNLTGGTAPDIVINVLTCGDAVGVGSYVYRRTEDRYENVFADEQPPVYAEIIRGDLELTKQVYGPGDAICCPTGEDVITYRWSAGRFSEQTRKHSDFSKSANGKKPTAAPEG
ncbi:hypothetical protein [Streptomyces sp. URMC 123]|uniref:hypothetical protein n=1 Tax=Streptomyces sp. URMC 123 TaxID=3423403 RepID=UPI003F1D45D9